MSGEERRPHFITEQSRNRDVTNFGSSRNGKVSAPSPSLFLMSRWPPSFYHRTSSKSGCHKFRDVTPRHLPPCPPSKSNTCTRFFFFFFFLQDGAVGLAEVVGAGRRSGWFRWTIVHAEVKTCPPHALAFFNRVASRCLSDDGGLQLSAGRGVSLPSFNMEVVAVDGICIFDDGYFAVPRAQPLDGLPAAPPHRRAGARRVARQEG